MELAGEIQLAQAAAQVPVPPLPQMAFAQQAQDGLAAEGLAADRQAKNAMAAAEIARKDAVAAADIEREDRKSQMETERQVADSIARDLMQKAGMARALDTMNATAPGGRRNSGAAPAVPTKGAPRNG